MWVRSSTILSARKRFSSFCSRPARSGPRPGFQKQRAEFERLKQDGVSPRDLFLRAYERYAALTDELRRNTVLAYQETKSLTLAERKRFLEGEERIQHFFEEIIAYGIDQGAFPVGDIRLKAHCLLVLAQSWAVRHWALSSFTKLDEYLEPLKSIALGILESDSQHTPALVAAQDDEEFVLSPELTS